VSAHDLSACLDAVEQRLVAATGDRSLCDLSRVGAPGSVKELEGRSAALRDALRLVRRGQAPDEHAAAEQVVAEWRRHLPLDERRGPVWLAYRRGGVDELDSFLSAR
jgi:hypothetical protein